MKTRREKLLVALLVIVATLAYVFTHSTFRLAIADDKLAAGVRHRTFLSGRLQTIDVVDVNLSTSVYRPRVLVDGVVREDADMTGAEPHTAAERVNDDRALAAVNGGFFGQKRHDGRVELVGVLVRDHKIINPTHDAEDASPAYARCALGIDDEGMPHIRWASTLTYGADALDKPDQDRLLAYDTPAAPTDPAMWRMRDVIGCAPRIVVRGRVESQPRMNTTMSRPFFRERSLLTIWSTAVPNISLWVSRRRRPSNLSPRSWSTTSADTATREYQTPCA